MFTRKLSVAIGALLVGTLVVACASPEPGMKHPASDDITPEPGSATTVSFSIDGAPLAFGEKLALRAHVTGATDPGVLWEIEEEDGGSITSAGVYTAPEWPGTFHLVARSREYPEAASRASVAVTFPTDLVRLTPAFSYVTTAQTLQLEGIIPESGHHKRKWPTDVEWSILEGDFGGSVDENGVYSPPPTAGTYHVIARAAFSDRYAAMATVTVTHQPVWSLVTGVPPSGYVLMDSEMWAASTTPDGYVFLNVHTPVDGYDQPAPAPATTLLSLANNGSHNWEISVPNKTSGYRYALGVTSEGFVVAGPTTYEFGFDGEPRRAFSFALENPSYLGIRSITSEPDGTYWLDTMMLSNGGSGSIHIGPSGKMGGTPPLSLHQSGTWYVPPLVESANAYMRVTHRVEYAPNYHVIFELQFISKDNTETHGVELPAEIQLSAVAATETSFTVGAPLDNGFWLARFTEEGELIWQRYYRSRNEWVSVDISAILASPDGEFLTVGEYWHALEAKRLLITRWPENGLLRFSQDIELVEYAAALTDTVVEDEVTSYTPGLYSGDISATTLPVTSAVESESRWLLEP